MNTYRIMQIIYTAEGDVLTCEAEAHIHTAQHLMARGPVPSLYGGYIEYIMA